MHDPNPTYVYNNTVYNIGNNASTLYGLYINYGRAINVFHNTVNVNLTSTGTSTMYAMYTVGSSLLASVQNNVVSFTGGNLGTKYGIYNGNTNTTANNGFQMNNVYMASTQTGTQYRNYHGGNRANIAAMRAAYPLMEVNTQEIDPLFADPTNGDLTPLARPLLLSGELLTPPVLYDITNTLRPVPPTPGAFDLYPKDFDNTGVDSLLQLGTNFCAGMKELKVRVQNYGVNNVDSVEVHWTLNGALQPSISYIMPIDGSFASINNSAEVTLGSRFLNFGINYELKVWTSNPNGRIDDYNVDDTLTKIITPNSRIIFDLGADTTICDNAELKLTAGLASNTHTYVWDNNTTANTRTLMGAGVYYVVKTNVATQCAGTDTILVNTKPSPLVDLGPDLFICKGTTATLDAGAININNSFLWDNNESNQTRVVSAEGDYYVTVTGANGCFTTDEVKVSYKDVPEHDGINAVYMLNATYNFNVVNPVHVQNAVWDFGDGSPLDTGIHVTHNYPRNGNYRVTVKLLSICDRNSDLTHSETLDAIGLSTNDLTATNEIKLYPNPSTDFVTLEIIGDAKMNRIEVYNAVGQMVHKLDLPSTNTTTISTDKLASGLYNIQIQTDKGTIFKKVDIIK